MTLRLRPLHPRFAAGASGLDLRAPTQAERVAFARQFGPLDLGLRKAQGRVAHRLDHEELTDISNVARDGAVAAREHAKIVNAFHRRPWLGDTSYSEEQRKRLPPVIGAHATHIVGRTLAEGRMLLAELLEHATQREFVYRHRWRVGDLVMRDNRCTLRRGRRFDLSRRRELRRTTTEDRV